jgi:hypothetical protein
MRAAVIFPALYAVALGLVFVAIAGWSRSGLVDLMRELESGLKLVLAGVSLALIFLSAWIAHALAAGRGRRAALLLGWIAALPGLIILFALAAKETGIVDLLGCEYVGGRDGHRCGNALVAAAINFANGLTLVAAHTLPFSAGPILFALGFAPIMLVRGAIGRLAKRRHATR